MKNLMKLAWTIMAALVVPNLVDLELHRVHLSFLMVSKFYLSGDYVPAYKNDLLDLVEKAGGSIVHTMEQLICQTGAAQATNSACLVVYNSDPPHGCAFGEESNILLQRLAKGEELAKPIGCQVIQHTWILESIATCELVPFCQ
ncbi:hypothetical protein K7X08_023400 [Anisodus acutangulus]|uniref:BRCT domain-containing protein n=1 Tax=Anisodus acutangulus TaxID=402998 RepID=A0A9Q1QZC2_9SOLA|nr:hypothetical protein K7X08_023400 [Anisodus acutangulus]